MLAGAVITCRYVAFKIGVLDRMIFGWDSHSSNFRVHRWSFWQRPRFQYAADLEPKIEMQLRRVVFLTDKPMLIGLCHFTARLRRPFEIAFLMIKFEAHLY